MSRTLFVITSPLQARHAAQYCLQEHIAPSSSWVALVKSRIESDNMRTRSILRLGGFSNVHEFEPLIRLGGVPLTAKGEIHRAIIKDYDDFASRRLFVQNVERFFESVGAAFARVVIGDYRPVSFRQFFRWLDLEKIECVLLDDGAVSQAVMAFRESNGNSPEIFRAKPFKSRLIDARDPLTYQDPSHLTYFSIYQNKIPDSDRILPNTYYDQFRERADFVTNGEVWVVGCNHVESEIAFEPEYVRLCQTAKELSNGRKCVYFPHRREDRDKINKIAFMIGAEIRHTNGIEDFIALNNAIPDILFTFGSTVLDTASRMIGHKTACVLLAPPPSYFRGPRREHIETVMRENVWSNADVIGLCSDDLNAARRWSARAVQRAGGSSAEPTAPAQGGAMAQTAANRIEGLVPSHIDGSATLLLETSAHGAHSFEAAAREIDQAGSAFVAFRLVGEGRSAVRIRVRKDGEPGCCAECDIDLERGGYGERRDNGIEMRVAAWVDEQRCAVVRVFFTGETAGRYGVEVITLPHAGAASPVMTGNPSIGVSMMAPMEYVGPVLDLPPERRVSVLQFRPSDDMIDVIRLRIGDRIHDLVLCPHPAQVDNDRSVNWSFLAYASAGPCLVFKRSAPIVIERHDNEIVFRTATGGVALLLTDPDAIVGAHVHDPYSGELKVMEIATGFDAIDPNECYVLAC